MSKKACIMVTAVFLAFIAAFFILMLVTPDVLFSERENRYLETLPKFSFSALFSGKYTTSFESYATDQFPFRDAWITGKAAIELASGKVENNGVYLCENDTLIEPFLLSDPDLIEKNIAALNTLTEKAGVPVYFTLVPEKSEIWSSLLPANVPNDSQHRFIESTYAQADAQTVDLYTALSSHSDEYIYYRTDHHWTTRGAYYGYAALCSALGLNTAPLSGFLPETVSEDFFGTLYASSGFSWVAPDSIDLYVKDPGTLSIKNYLNGTPEEGTLYDFSYLDKKDKYSMFFGGNTPLVTIDTGLAEGERILILRDSYADSLVPFFLSDFSEIHMIDLRYYKPSVLDYIETHEIDRVLVLYSVSNFASDGNLALMGK